MDILETARLCKQCVSIRLLCCMSRDRFSHLPQPLGEETVFLLPQTTSNHSQRVVHHSLSTTEFSLYLACNPHSRSISLVEVYERIHQSSGVTVVSVFVGLQNHPGKPLLHCTITLGFLSPGFEVILSTIFTLSVTRSLSENSAKPTASSERYHKWFCMTFLAAVLISQSVDSHFPRSIQRSWRIGPRGSPVNY